MLKCEVYFIPCSKINSKVIIDTNVKMNLDENIEGKLCGLKLFNNIFDMAKMK
jgi:hypothetical protein